MRPAPTRLQTAFDCKLVLVVRVRFLIACFFVTALAAEFNPEARISPFLAQYPFARYERRIMAHVLIVAAL